MKIYLATPYSHKDDAVRVKRFEAVNVIAGDLMRQGHLVFPPISHTHPIALAGDLPLGWEFWQEYDRTFIEWCDEVHVFMQHGWDESKGVTGEIKIAQELQKPIFYRHK